MPLTDFQRAVLALLAANRSPDSYPAGGAALHFAPNSLRFGNDLGFFHDSEERVASAFAEDSDTLRGAGYDVDVELSQPGHIHALLKRGGDSTRIDWAHDTSWRFMPPVQVEGGGYLLHDIDLAVNKLLALAGRDEPRDFVDILFVHENILPLGALCWAAVGKDPGFAPHSLVDLLKRRGRPRPEELQRLHLVEPLDAISASSGGCKRSLMPSPSWPAARPRSWAAFITPPRAKPLWRRSPTFLFPSRGSPRTSECPAALCHSLPAYPSLRGSLTHTIPDDVVMDTSSNGSYFSPPVPSVVQTAPSRSGESRVRTSA